VHRQSQSSKATEAGFLLLDVDGSEWAMKPRNLYVAASRARLRLHVFAGNGVEVAGRG